MLDYFFLLSFLFFLAFDDIQGLRGSGDQNWASHMQIMQPYSLSFLFGLTVLALKYS